MVKGKFRNEARKAVLKIIAGLTVEDPEHYYNSNILSNLASNGRDYGIISQEEVGSLLKPYIDNGMVYSVSIRRGYPEVNGYTVGYKANMKMIVEIKKELGI